VTILITSTPADAGRLFAAENRFAVATEYPHVSAGDG
jgi:hypothetical protein